MDQLQEQLRRLLGRFSVRKAVFTGLALAIALFFLLQMNKVGSATGNFGLDELRGETPVRSGAAREYETVWNPEDGEIEAIDIVWVNGDVTLRVGESHRFRVVESVAGRVLGEDERMALSFRSGTLSVAWKEQPVNLPLLGNSTLGDRLFNVPLLENTRKDLLVEVPFSAAGELTGISCVNSSGDVTVAGMTAGEVSLSSEAGSVNLSDLTGETLQLSTVSGDITAQGLDFSESITARTTSGQVTLGAQTGELNLKGATGDLRYFGTAYTVNSTSVSGETLLRCGNCPEKAELSSVSGSLRLVVPDNDGFELEYSSVSGDFTTGFPLRGGSAKSDRLLYQNGRAKLSMKTSSGDMKLELGS